MNISIHRAAIPGTLLLVLGLSIGACRTSAPSVPRYIVTATPLNLIGIGHPGFCIAVDPADRHGVWWWEAGPSGCSSSINGPTVFHAERATVAAPANSGNIDVRFELQLMSGPRDVRLVLQDGTMRFAASGEGVSTERRGDLDIPPAYGR